MCLFVHWFVCLFVCVCGSHGITALGDVPAQPEEEDDLSPKGGMAVAFKQALQLPLPDHKVRARASSAYTLISLNKKRSTFGQSLNFLYFECSRSVWISLF